MPGTSINMGSQVMPRVPQRVMISALLSATLTASPGLGSDTSGVALTGTETPSVLLMSDIGEQSQEDPQAAKIAALKARYSRMRGAAWFKKAHSDRPLGERISLAY